MIEGISCMKDFSNECSGHTNIAIMANFAGMPKSYF